MAQYIVCIQKEDFDEAKIPMENIFKVIEEHAVIWADMRSSGEFGRLESQLVLRIANDTGVAIVQTEENGEVNTKPKYLNQLKKISGIL